MDSRARESGLELVLDNRRLIVAFALLITICGCFFVLGFVEGKRQGVNDAARNTPTSSAGEQRDAKAARLEPDKKQVGERSVKEQLDWYKSVNDRGEANAKKSDKPAGAPPKGGESSKPAAEKAAADVSAPAASAINQPPSAKTTYSAQVGAFRQRKEAEAKARMLKAKGYTQFFIESPTSAHQLFLLKVGKFESRAEAVSMQLRLRKDGLTSFIKANN